MVDLLQSYGQYLTNRQIKNISTMKWTTLCLFVVVACVLVSAQDEECAKAMIECKNKCKENKGRKDECMHACNEAKRGCGGGAAGEETTAGAETTAAAA